MMLRKIGKREARFLYNNGVGIVMAGEPWWFDGEPREHAYAPIVRYETHGDFDDLVALSQDSRYQSPRVSFAREDH